MENEKKYFAFISYKEEDYEMAKWLQHKVEHYHLPSITRKKHPNLPQKIKPVFEYKSEMAGGFLKPAIKQALDESKYLIVICSPNTPQSPWVAGEVQHFIDEGQIDCIIPFVVAGEAYSKDPDLECFPKPLRELKESLRGISINEMGRDAAAVKVVAQMFGLGFDELWQRYEREQKRKHRLVFWGVVAFALLALGVAGWIWQQSRRTQEMQSRFVGKEALTLANGGDNDKALRLINEVLPRNLCLPNRPYTPEAEFVLRKLNNSPSLINTLKKHNKRITYLSYSPDGQFLLSAALDDSLICIWDTETGVCIDSLVGHTSSVNSVVFNKDGDRILSGSFDGTFRIWDWNAQTNKCIKVIKTGWNARNAFFFNNGASRFISNYPPVVRDTTGTIIQSLGKDAEFVAIDHNGEIAAVSYKNGKIGLWDVEKGECLDTIIGHSESSWVKSVMFNNNGDLIVSASTDSTIRIWNIKRGDCINTLLGHTGRVWHAEFNSNDSLIVSASADSTFRIWNAIKGSLLYSVKQTDQVSFVTFHPNEHQIACGLQNGEIKIFHYDNHTDMCLAQKMPIKGFSYIILGFINDGKQVAVLFPKTSWSTSPLFSSFVSSTIEFFDLETGEHLPQFSISIEGDSIPIMRGSTVQDNIINQSFPNFILSSNIVLGQKFHTLTYTNPIIKKNIRLLGLSGINTNYFLSIPEEGDMELYHLGRMRIKKIAVIYNEHPYRVHSLGIKNDSGVNNHIQSISLSKNFLIMAINNIFYVWNLNSGRIIYEKSVGSPIKTAAFTPDEKQIITISEDNFIRVYDFPSLQDLIDQNCERFKNRPLTPEERRQYYLE